MIAGLSLFEKYSKMIAIDLSNEQALDADLKVIQQFNFTKNVGQAGNIAMLFIIEERKETILDLSQGSVRILLIFFCFNIISIWNGSI